jgi:hypothetical protein
MATVDEIKATILKVAGDPIAGPIAALAAEMAQAIAELDQKRVEPAKEIRVVNPAETRWED